MKHKTLDEALLALNEEVTRFACHSDRILGRSNDLESENRRLEEENERLNKALENSHEAYEQCVTLRKGWQDMYFEKDKEHDELWEKYMKLLRSK